jgi:hypothetical protein
VSKLIAESKGAWTQKDETQVLQKFADSLGVSGAQKMLPWMVAATQQW